MHPSNNREVEWQLSAPDLSTVRQWLNTHPVYEGLTIEPRSTLSIQDTYLDTPEWHIFRAGYALRLRVEQGRHEVSLKQVRSAREGVADREEITESVEAAPAHPSEILALPGEVGTRVRKFVGPCELRVLFDVRTNRERFAAVNDEGRLAEITLDSSQLSAPGGKAGLALTRVEVEAHTLQYEHTERLVKALRSDCGLEPASKSKFSTGLQVAGLFPPRV